MSPHRLKTINKTAGTSKVVPLRSFDHKEVYNHYESSLSNIEGMIRFDIPWTYSTLLGTRIEQPFLMCSIENDVITLSHLGHRDEYHFKVPLYYCSNKHRSLKSNISIDEDYQFFLLSKDLVPFDIDQKVTFRYLGDNGITERKFTVSVEDDVRYMNYQDLLTYHRNRWSARTRRFMPGHLDNKEVMFNTTLDWWENADKMNNYIYKDCSWFEIYPNTTCFANEFQDEPGYVSWAVCNFENAPKGTGKKVKEIVHEKVKAMGFKKVRVLVHKDNKAILKVLHDYEELSIYDGWYIMAIDL